MKGCHDRLSHEQLTQPRYRIYVLYDTYTGHPEIKEFSLLEGFLAGGDNRFIGVFGTIMENLLYCIIQLWSPNSPLSVGSLS